MRTVEDIFREVGSVADFSGITVKSVDDRNGYGDSPLHIVSNWGDCEAIELLVAAGADVNAVGETGFTSLHCAAEQNRPKAISKLLELGALERQDSNGQSPKELAEILGHREAVSAFAQIV